jgi:tetratricopeptide (TPR) repeat protein
VIKRMVEARGHILRGHLFICTGHVADGIDALIDGNALAELDGDSCHMVTLLDASHDAVLTDFLNRNRGSDSIRLKVALIRACYFVKTFDTTRAERILTEVLGKVDVLGNEELLSMVYGVRRMVWANQAKWTENIQDCDECLALRPNKEINHYFKGFSLCQLERYTEAEKCFERFLDLAPLGGRKYPMACFLLGIVKLKLSRALHKRDVAVRECFERARNALPGLIPSFRKQVESSDCAKFAELMMVHQLQDTNATTSSINEARLSLALRALTTKRENANVSYKQGQYEVAIKTYTQIVDELQTLHAPDAGVDVDLAIVFRNRSASYYKLQMYALAEGDAVFALKYERTSLKAHARLIQAKLAQYDIEGYECAIEACKTDCSGTNNQPVSIEDVRALFLSNTSDATDVSSQDSPLTCKPQPCKRDTLECWTKVSNKASCIVVDHAGAGDFTSLREALVSVQQSTTIVVLEGTYSNVRWQVNLIIELQQAMLSCFLLQQLWLYCWCCVFHNQIIKRN